MKTTRNIMFRGNFKSSQNSGVSSQNKSGFES